MLVAGNLIGDARKGMGNPQKFSPAELAILRAVQGDLPDSKRPYRDLAEISGLTEEEVIHFLQSLKDAGVIRRFGASLRHHNTGWKYNSMVAWKADEEEAEKWAHLLKDNPKISHAYFRPSRAQDWPYELYTMIHGQQPEDIERTVAWLAASWPFEDYIILDTVRELKKISMTYFE